MGGDVVARNLGTFEDQERRDHQHRDRGEDAVNVVEREHRALRLDGAINQPEALLVARDHLRQISQGWQARPVGHAAQPPRLEDRKVLDQVGLVNLLMADQSVGHVGNADCRPRIAHHVVETRREAQLLMRNA